MIFNNIYMDNAASTKPSQEVINTLNKTLEIYGNPSSIHSQGELANNIIQNASVSIASRLGCKPYEIHYTCGASMSNSIFIQGFLNRYKNSNLVISEIEHNDIIMLSNYIDPTRVYKIPVDKNGLLDMDYFIYILNNLIGSHVICSIQMANGECGTIQDIKSISHIIHSHVNMFLHCDATQYIPYYKLNVKELGIDALSMSGQKINCIKGTGLLYIDENLKIDPVIFGEQGIIGGTENVLGIACLEEAFKNINYDIKDLINKRDYFIDKLSGHNIIGDLKNRLPNNIYVQCNNIDSESMVIFLNEFGICASAGSACSFNGSDPSHVVLALGYSEEVARSCVRFTINNKTTYEEIDYVADTFNKIDNKGE